MDHAPLSKVTWATLSTLIESIQYRFEGFHAALYVHRVKGRARATVVGLLSVFILTTVDRISLIRPIIRR